MKIFNKFKLLIRDKVFTPEDLSNLFNCCQNNDINGVKQIFENRRIKTFKIPSDNLLKVVFQKGYLEIAQYLLTSPYTKEFHKEQLNEPLAHACLHSGKEIVKYVLNSKELLKRVDLSKLSESILESSCAMMNTPVINFILQNKEILKYINLHHNHDELFKRLVYNEEHETMRYLIINANIEQTEEIKSFLNSANISNYYGNIDNIKNMFQMRDLNEELNGNLKIGSANSKKVKI